jgi:ubiquinone/menaquinone biosynthesis C-methylase UbiE
VLAEKTVRDPRRVLDVGCGSGELLRLLATIFPAASELRGVDPAPSMTAVAMAAAHDQRLSFDTAAAERLPYPDGHFDLVVRR